MQYTHHLTIKNDNIYSGQNQQLKEGYFMQYTQHLPIKIKNIYSAQNITKKKG